MALLDGLPLWLAVVIGLASLASIPIGIILFQRYIEWLANKFQELDK